MKAFYEESLKVFAGLWQIFCVCVAAVSFLIAIFSFVDFVANDAHWLATIRHWVVGEVRDYVGGKIAQVFDAILSNGIAVMVSSTLIGTLYIVPVIKSFKAEIVGVPKIINNFFHPLEKTLNDAARIELGEVEMRAWAVLRERGKVLKHVSGLYSALWHDFHDLELLMAPDGAPPTTLQSQRIPIESNLKCEGCGSLGPCGCRAAYVEATKIEAEKRGETLGKLRAALDRVAHRRVAIRQDLDSELKLLLNAIHHSADVKPGKEETLLMRLGQALRLSVATVFALALIILVLAVKVPHP